MITNYASTRCPLFGTGRTPLGLPTIDLFDVYAPIQIGVYGAPLDCDTAQDPHAASGNKIPLYANLTSSITDGNVYGAWIHLKQTADTTGSPRTLTLWCVVSHPTTTTCAGANALHAQTYVDTGCTGVTGGVHAAASHLIVAQEERSLSGTYCAHLFVNEFEDDNTMPASTYFLRFDDAGVKKTPYFFDVSNATAGTDNMYSTDPSDVQNGKVAATLKVRVGGTDYWIPLWDVKTGA